MATAALVVLTIVLVLAAAYVGLLLVRRSRAAQSADPDGPRTVGDLVRQQETPADDLSGSELFAPSEPRKGIAPVPPPVERDDAARTVEVALPPPAGPLQTPVDGIEAGDAPWRRAARMMGAEPGARWETAPVPVVPAPAKAVPDESGATAVIAVPALAGATRGPAVSGPGASGSGSGSGAAGPAAAVVAPRAPEPRAAEPQAADTRAAEPQAAEVRDAEVRDARTPEPRAAEPSGPRPAGSTAVWTLPEDTATAARPEPPVAAPDAPPVSDAPPASDAPSHPLSDPDLTPLMGIPVVRPQADPAPPAAPAPSAGGVRAPRAAVGGDDDEVVSMRPSTTAARPPATGSPQPVWFRVVRRDGEPVAAAVVALLDPHGHEADVTKTATDGGGELQAPHGGRFLMIASAEGFQPRVVTLTVDEQPVELALLLPRSATVAGSVRGDGEPVAGARVVARQEGEIVDETVTGPDGGYRFGDLAEGVYAVTAAAHRGGAAGRVTVSEGAELHLDLDLAGPDGAP